MYLPSYSPSASMIRQSAPSCAACAPTCASSSGWLPYTYCQAHTRRPAEWSVDTRVGLNCDHMVEPSLDLIITVLMPYWRAVAMIEDVVPPDERDTYQIHMPRPASESAALCTGLLRAAPGASRSPVTISATSRATQRPRCSVI